MVERLPEIRPKPNIPEVLKTSHVYGVVMPYSSNLDSSGEPRLSFYSAFALNATSELYRKRHIEQIILCGESTFGEAKATTSELMKDGLLRLGVAQHDITMINNYRVFDNPDMPEGIIRKQLKLGNTASQIKALAEFQQKKIIFKKNHF